MEIINFIIEILTNILGIWSLIINSKLDEWFQTIVLALVLAYDIIILLRSNELRKGILTVANLTVVEGMLVLVVILIQYVPQLLYQWVLQKIPEETIRWILIYAFSLVVYLGTREYGGWRGFYSYLGHISILFIGWKLLEWAGVIFFSLPLLAVYYNTIYLIAMAIVPASDHDSPALRFKDLPLLKDAISGLLKHLFKSNIFQLIKDTYRVIVAFIRAVQIVGGEKWKRFLVLVWYFWGVQFPLFSVADSFGRQFEPPRITGSPFNKLFAPGLINGKSHHAVGITTGIQFSRVDGPGVVFMGAYERPFEIVDLRTQLRTSEIEAISKDGHPFTAILFASFAIDRQEWNTAEFHRLQRANPILKNGKIMDHNTGNYPFSYARIRAALSTTSIHTTPLDVKTPTIHWDERVISQLEEAARLILAQRNLDELWKPQIDNANASALDEISTTINQMMAPRLREWGIQLFSARIVNFKIPENHPIIKQQIATWSAIWEQRAAQTLAQGQAEAERLQQEAKAYAYSALLNSVADRLQRIRLTNPDLARHIIAMRFISALEELIHQQPEETSEDLNTRLNTLKQQVIFGQI